MSFLDDVARARAVLAEHGRVSVRALRRELALDEEILEELVEELVDVQQVVERRENLLVWLGDAEGVGRSSPSSQEAAGAAPLPGEAGESTPRPSPTGDGGERRQLTVMFADLVGSTTLSESIDPEELRDLMRSYRTVCDEAVKRFGGHIAQYLGDGVLAFFGYPDAREDAAEASIRAGLEIQRLLAERVADERIQARIGIHTGLVVTDETDTDSGGVLGSATNVAARIEAVAKSGSVVVSEATLALCRGSFITRNLGETELKGVEDPVVLHEVERGGRLPGDAGPGATTPIVGRDREIGLLLERWEEARDGRGQVALISGEAGMGKSRLLQALRDGIGEVPHAWLSLQCSPFTSGTAFQPVVDIFHRWLTEAGGHSPEESGKLFVDVLEAMPGLPGDRVIPYLLPLLSLPPSPNHPLPQTSVEEQRERTLAALAQLNLSLSDQQPVVVVVEDLHWSDPSTLEYLGRLVSQAPTARLLLVMSFRPEFDPPWSQSHVSTIRLGRLSKNRTRQLIANAVGGQLPEPVLVELEARSDGVPLFAEELTTSVVSSGVIAEHSGRYELRGSLKSLAIPMTLQDSLMARLDRLSASKLVAQQASVIGRQFTYELIEEVTDFDTPTLRKALDQLVDAEVVYQRGMPPDAIYSFKHALLQDTAYESQLLSNRKALHARIATALEERFPHRVEAEPELVARHCAAAGENHKAVGHYRRAAELAVARHSNVEASELLERSLDELGQLPESEERAQREIEIWLLLAQALSVVEGYRGSRVLAAQKRVEALCSQMEEGPQQLPALIGLIQLALNRAALTEAGVWAEILGRIAEPLGIPELTLVARYMYAACLLARSVPESEAAMERTLETLHSIDFPPPATPYIQDLPALIHATHGAILIDAGKPDRAIECVANLRARLAEIDHDLSTSGALSASSFTWVLARDPEAARELAEESLAVSAERGFHAQEVLCKIIRGWALAVRGDAAGGLADVDDSLALLERTGSEVVTPVVYVTAADVCRMAKQPERAAELLDRATALGEDAETSNVLCEIMLSRAQLELELGNRPEARRLLLTAGDRADEGGFVWTEMIISTELARLAKNEDEMAAAHDRLASSYAKLRDGHGREPAREAKAALDQLAARIAAS